MLADEFGRPARYWTHWLSITVMVGAMLVVDVMFLDDRTKSLFEHCLLALVCILYPEFI